MMFEGELNKMGESDDNVCIACGDGADSAEELQELIEEKEES